MGQWAVIAVLVGALLLSQNGIGIAAQPYRNGYACWGGCYNVCILQTGKNPAERLPCYLQCLGGCIANPDAASDNNNRYYCQLGCSLDQCIRFSSDGTKQESCLANCSTKICNINT